MMQKIALGALALCLSASLHAAGNADAGKVKAETCMGCHGIPGYTNVYPTYKVPKLAGQHADYLVAALTAYKNGERKHPTMQAQAGSLSAEDIADIAAYFSAAGQ
jgi:cytochrome c553